MINILAEKAKEYGRPLILDGAIGSLLIEKGFQPDAQLWTAKAGITHPELLIEIHKNYIEAGANIITTNTFRSNPAFSDSSDELVKANVQAAFKAKADNEILIAGSNAPAEDCYFQGRTFSRRQLEDNHFKHIDNLIKHGVDIVWNETFSQLDEIKLVIEYCSKKDVPFVISLIVDENLRLFSGEDIKQAIKIILSSDALAVGFNCISKEVFRKLKNEVNTSFPWGFYLNCGEGSYEEEYLKCGLSPEAYKNIIANNTDRNLVFTGSCCGSNFTHTKAIRDMYHE